MNNKAVFNLNDICACIVTYNPEVQTWDNVRIINKQVGKVLIVDNSNDEIHIEVESRAQENNCSYIWNHGNKGLAYALNVGLNYAETEGYKLFLTLDQDSMCEEQMISMLLKCINKNGDRVSVGPCWNNEDLNEDRKVKYLITSGNITPTKALLDVGGYDNAFFIDSIDMDISLLLREKGYDLIKVKDAILFHNIGEAEKSKILHIPYMAHSSKRMYYIYRNHILLRRKHFRKKPIFIIKLYFFHVVETLKIILIESQKREKLCQALRGIRDAYRYK